jgi:hypothetical protein
VFELVAQREAPLNEVTKRCLRWRDAAAEVLGECAQELATPPQVLARAVAMTQMTLDVTLVRVCEAFEGERERTRASSPAAGRSSRSSPPTIRSQDCRTGRCCSTVASACSRALAVGARRSRPSA